ncbi:hypothetical protein L207DRAFT_581539 [Hyaloscypha variabilis F]|uniref:DUF7730 domain-containing protein n=1 Tax=Hyaloscypha variabilis (strain UAMH 11265 / GT02V1 / F) TaxID=1149755 RepID=A0A2J6RRF1_HYAVF|nr:hypothetical protein L207DRAFT_581539 [Hyaloscypha variabilis F]
MPRSLLQNLYPDRQQAGRQILQYAAWAILGTCSKLMPDLHWEEYDPRDGYIRTTPLPKALKTKRKRRLIEISEMNSQSPLLGLPREIRDMIWRYVVGGKQIHWRIEARKLTGKVCWSENELCYSQCLAWLWKGPGPQPVIGVMGVLLSCRQTYSETIELVHSQNTFDTTQADVIAFLPRLLLPESFNAIRNIQLLLSVWMPPSYPQNYDPSMPLEKLEKAKKNEHYYRKIWNAIWKNFTEMESLVNVRVEINVPWRLQYLWEAKEFDPGRLEAATVPWKV